MTEADRARALEVVIVSGSPERPSKTEALATLVASRVAEHVETATSTVRVYDLGTAFTSAVRREDAGETAERALAAVEAADLVIPAIPVFRGAYPGIFKHFFDMVGQYALAGTPVLPVATGGSDRHALVIDQVLRPLFGFFQALVAPAGVYESAAQFDGTTLLDARAYTRIEVAVDDLVPILRLRATEQAAAD